MKSRTFAFTLIELMIVIAMIAFLIAIFLPYFGNRHHQNNQNNHDFGYNTPIEQR